jgi:hypothetical protein
MTEARPRLHLRAVLVLSLLALVVALLPGTAAQAQQNGNWSATTACPGGANGVQPSGFTDATGPHGRNIECLAWYGLTAGQTATTYGNLNNLRRDQTASFLVRVMDRWTISGYDMPARERNAFPDVDSGPHRANIEILAGAEPPIVQGFRDGTYGPVLPVTRAQFASFVVRALDSAADQGLIDRLPNASSPFRDTGGSVHESNIARLANVGVLLGRDSRTFAPNENITRGQTASVIARVLGGLVDEGIILPPQRISGIVHDATGTNPDQIGTPIAGATVRAVGFVTTQVTTGQDGRYTVWMQRPDNVFIHTRANGFAEQFRPIQLPDADLDPNIRMYRGAAEPTADRQSTATAADVTVTQNGRFWRVGTGDIQNTPATEVRIKYPSGQVLALGASNGPNVAFFDRNPDGTSDRADWSDLDGGDFGDESGDHILFYRVNNEWVEQVHTFNEDGSLIAVNGTPYADPDYTTP